MAGGHDRGFGVGVPVPDVSGDGRARRADRPPLRCEPEIQQGSPRSLAQRLAHHLDEHPPQRSVGHGCTVGLGQHCGRQLGGEAGSCPCRGAYRLEPQRGEPWPGERGGWQTRWRLRHFAGRRVAADDAERRHGLRGRGHGQSVRGSAREPQHPERPQAEMRGQARDVAGPVLDAPAWLGWPACQVATRSWRTRQSRSACQTDGGWPMKMSARRTPGCTPRSVGSPRTPRSASADPHH